MEIHKEKILAEYDQNHRLYTHFGRSLETLIESLLRSAQINPHLITLRVKDRPSLVNKIASKGYKYSQLSDITDIVGLRIITYMEDDIEIISEVINKEFLIDLKNSSDKGQELDATEFGYKSVHYVVSYSHDRSQFTEIKDFAGLKAEIQVRSILQHSWADAYHHLGYKNKMELPKAAQRTFARIAAFLEQADIEFTKMKKEIESYEKNLPKDIINEPEKVKIDKASVFSFMHDSDIIRETEKELTSELPLRLNAHGPAWIEQLENTVSNLLPKIIAKNINSIEELKQYYINHISFIKDFGRGLMKKLKEVSKFEHAYMNQGETLTWLFFDDDYIKQFID